MTVLKAIWSLWWGWLLGYKRQEGLARRQGRGRAWNCSRYPKETNRKENRRDKNILNIQKGREKKDIYRTIIQNEEKYQIRNMWRKQTDKKEEKINKLYFKTIWNQVKDVLTCVLYVSVCLYILVYKKGGCKLQKAAVVDKGICGWQTNGSPVTARNIWSSRKYCFGRNILLKHKFLCFWLKEFPQIRFWKLLFFWETIANPDLIWSYYYLWVVNQI